MKTFFLIILIFCVLHFLNISYAKSKLIKLNDDNWDELLTGEWMVEFHAPWCPACKHLQPQWELFSSWSDDIGIKVANIDVTANPGLSGRFMVTALPTIYHVRDGVFRQYKGARDSDAFVAFIEEKKWKSIEPISSWKAPNSIQMSIVSYFFKVSMALRSIYNRLTEDYGIPTWALYVLLALTTILLGAILGLIIVCIIDIAFPYKRPVQSLPEKDVVGDLIADDHVEGKTEELEKSSDLRKRKTEAQ